MTDIVFSIHWEACSGSIGNEVGGIIAIRRTEAEAKHEAVQTALEWARASDRFDPANILVNGRPVCLPYTDLNLDAYADDWDIWIEVDAHTL